MGMDSVPEGAADPEPRGTPGSRSLNEATRILSYAVVLTSLATASPALADANAAGSHSIIEADHSVRGQPRHRTFGMSMDVGVPDGAALGLVIRPDWLRIGAAVTHNGMAPGVRLGVTLDPFESAMAPTFTVEGGHYWEGRLPLIQGSPAIVYNYANFHLGLEVGSRAAFRFFLRGGASWLGVSAANFQSAGGAGGSQIGNPSYSGWLAPSGKLGFSAYF
jgi:hypothetical protein